MRDLFFLAIHLLVTLVKLFRRRIPKLGAFIEPATLRKRSTTGQATPEPMAPPG